MRTDLATPEQVRAALHGIPDTQAAAALRVSRRSVRRYKSGALTISLARLSDLEHLR